MSSLAARMVRVPRRWGWSKTRCRRPDSSGPIARGGRRSGVERATLKLDGAGLPGAELVRDGVADLARGVESIPALLVSIGAPRLRDLGLEVQRPIADPSFASTSCSPGRIRTRRIRATTHSSGGSSASSARPNARASRRSPRAKPDARPRRGCRRRDHGVSHGRQHGGPLRLARDDNRRRHRLCPRERQPPARHSAAQGGAEGQRGARVARRFHSCPRRLGGQKPVRRAGGTDHLPPLRPHSQALAKLERGHDRDLADVRAMLAAGLVESGRAMALFGEIEERLYRFPAIDPPSFRLRVEQELGHQ